MVMFSPYNHYRVPGMPILRAHRTLGLGLALHILTLEGLLVIYGILNPTMLQKKICGLEP